MDKFMLCEFCGKQCERKNTIQRSCIDCRHIIRKEQRHSPNATWNKPEARRESSRRHRAKNPDKVRAYLRDWYANNKDKNYAKKTKEALKALVFEKYGNACSCCGENRLIMLTLDHRLNDGYLDRGKNTRGGAGLYRKARDEGFPDTYRLLCWNCNCGRPRGHGDCVHKVPYVFKDDLSKNKKQKLKLKFQIQQAYGSKCTCCREDNFWFLTLDHINNDGYLSYKQHDRSGHGLYSKVIRENFPDTYQLLCWNCNLSKHYNQGVCIHKVESK